MRQSLKFIATLLPDDVVPKRISKQEWVIGIGDNKDIDSFDLYWYLYSMRLQINIILNLLIDVSSAIIRRGIRLKYKCPHGYFIDIHARHVASPRSYRDVYFHHFPSTVLVFRPSRSITAYDNLIFKCIQSIFERLRSIYSPESTLCILSYFCIFIIWNCAVQPG